jgi:hypothetical protein
MGINNNGPCFARLPHDNRNYYQKPAIWIDELPQVSFICAGSPSGNTGQEGGDSNEDNTFWDENESLGLVDENQGHSLWDKEE